MKLLNLLGTLSPAQITWFTWVKKGKKTGVDYQGNIYYEAPPRKGYKRPRRWVIYKGQEEATSVPPEWHGWLHHQTDTVPDQENSAYRKRWQKPHTANKTGTSEKYLPEGHVLKEGKRARTYGDYEPWSPNDKHNDS